MNQILTDAERSRFHALRNRHVNGDALTPEEQGELDAFRHKIEAAEAVYLRPANERAAQRIAALTEQGDALRAVLEREKAFQAHLE